MPGWQPSWHDVAFDHAAAADAAEQCRETARRIDEVLAALGAARPAVTASWAGRLVGEFEAEESAVAGDLELVRAEALALAASIDAAADDARAEQRRREADRDRWHEEKAAADRRRELEQRGIR